MCIMPFLSPILGGKGGITLGKGHEMKVNMSRPYREGSFDSRLDSFYARKLLIPGWAGEVNDAEAAYIARELIGRPVLRRLWRLATFTRRRKSVTPAMVKKLARRLAEKPVPGIETRFSDTVELTMRARMSKGM